MVGTSTWLALEIEPEKKRNEAVRAAATVRGKDSAFIIPSSRLRQGIKRFEMMGVHRPLL
jgi:hypothetical protein